MLTRVECPNDNQRLFDVSINEKEPVSLEPLSKLVDEIEIKCPRCGGIVSIDLRFDNLKVSMKDLGNRGRSKK